MDKVCIMMSTYNGEKFLREQMDSIFSQQDINPYLLIRDDGSSDSTVEIIKNYMSLYPDHIKLILGKNIGWEDSFFELMYEAAADNEYRDVEYFAFADQDDVWMSDKSLLGINAIRGNERASFYYADAMIIDEGGMQLFKYECRKMSKESIEKKKMLLEGSGLAMGCTLMLNRKLLEIATYGAKEKLLHKNIPHDQWISMAAVYHGRVVSGNEISVMHRRHEKSVTNSGRKRKRKLILGYTVHKASAFADIYVNSGLLSKTDEEYLRVIQNYKINLACKIKLLLDPYLRYPSVLGSIKLKLAIMLSTF